MGRYVLRRLLNYVVLLVVAVSLTYFLAATQLNPRSLYQVQNPPLDPAVIEATLRDKNLSDTVPIGERYRTWVTGVITRWDWGQGPRGEDVNDESAGGFG